MWCPLLLLLLLLLLLERPRPRPLTRLWLHIHGRNTAAEADFAEWADRLHCYGLDLREVQAVERFCAHVLEKYGRLDILVNNACQTVRRPVGKDCPPPLSLSVLSYCGHCV